MCLGFWVGGKGCGEVNKKMGNGGYSGSEDALVWHVLGIILCYTAIFLCLGGVGMGGDVMIYIYTYDDWIGREWVQWDLRVVLLLYLY